MTEKFIDIVREFWGVLAEMSPYLLFGFFVAGVLSVLLKAETVERHLGGHGLWPIIKASAFGVPLPLCSCGVIPVATSLRKHGASRGATTSFLISTPQTGVDSIFVTLSLLGPAIAIFRPIAAFLSGIIGGSIISVSQREEENETETSQKCEDACCMADSGRRKLLHILKYGFVTLPQDIAKALLVGIAIAGIIAVFVPGDFFAGRLGQGITGMLVMMVFGIPVYVCATASVPVAAAFIAKGASPGAAIVFLMTGPATNAAAISIIWKIMGRRTAIIYIVTVALCALAAGLGLNLVLDNLGTPADAVMMKMLPEFMKTLAALILLALLAFAIFSPLFGRRKANTADGEDDTGDTSSTVLKIDGMTCSHCTNAVKRSISESKGVKSVDVDLSSGVARFTGKSFDVSAITKSIEELGYKIANKKATDNGD